MHIKKMFLFLFNRKEYRKLQKMELLDSFVPELLGKLSMCQKFDDLIMIHKEMVGKGFDFETGWNFDHVDIGKLKIENLVFFGYDRDTCIHGRELSYLENNDNDDDWLNWSYWVSWKWYYNTLYKRIKYHRNPIIEEEVNTPFPPAVENYFSSRNSKTLL